jgi:hypothetical protein
MAGSEKDTIVNKNLTSLLLRTLGLKTLGFFIIDRKEK